MASGQALRPLQGNEIAGRLMPSMSVYALIVVSKLSSKMQPQERFIGVCPPYLFLLTMEGTITRLLLLPEIERIQRDRQKGRVLLIPRQSARERDWLFDWVDDARTTVPDCDAAVELLRETRSWYTRDPLPIEDQITRTPQLLVPPDGMGPKDRVAHLHANPDLVPVRLHPIPRDGGGAPPAPGQVDPEGDSLPPPSDDPDAEDGITLEVAPPTAPAQQHTVRLADPGEAMGIAWVYLPPGGIVIKSMPWDGPAQRAGLPLGATIVGIAGMRIRTPSDLGAAVRALRKAGSVEFRVTTQGGFNMNAQDDEETPLPPPSDSQESYYYASGSYYTDSQVEPFPAAERFPGALQPLPPRDTVCRYFCSEFDRLFTPRTAGSAPRWRLRPLPRSRRPRQQQQQQQQQQQPVASSELSGPPRPPPPPLQVEEVCELRTAAGREFAEMLKDPSILERTQLFAARLIAAGCPEIVLGAVLDACPPPHTPPLHWVAQNTPAALRALVYGGPRHLCRIAAQDAQQHAPQLGLS